MTMKIIKVKPKRTKVRAKVAPAKTVSKVPALGNNSKGVSGYKLYGISPSAFTKPKNKKK